MSSPWRSRALAQRDGARPAAGGSSGLGVVATFVVAAALAALTAPLAGAIVDRRGPLVPVRAGLIVMSASVLCLGFAYAPLVVAILTLLCVAGARAPTWGVCDGDGRAHVGLPRSRDFDAQPGVRGGRVGGVRRRGREWRKPAGDLRTLLSLGCVLAVAAGALAASIAHEGGRWLGLGDRRAAPANGDWRNLPTAADRRANRAPLARRDRDQLS